MRIGIFKKIWTRKKANSILSKNVNDLVLLLWSNLINHSLNTVIKFEHTSHSTVAAWTGMWSGARRPLLRLDCKELRQNHKKYIIIVLGRAVNAH